jgi:hypothetical protein
MLVKIIFESSFHQHFVPTGRVIGVTSFSTNILSLAGQKYKNNFYDGKRYKNQLERCSDSDKNTICRMNIVTDTV